MIVLKTIAAGAAIAASLGLAGLGVGAGVANAAPPSVTSGSGLAEYGGWGYGHGGGWHGGGWRDGRAGYGAAATADTAAVTVRRASAVRWGCCTSAPSDSRKGPRTLVRGPFRRAPGRTLIPQCDNVIEYTALCRWTHTEENACGPTSTERHWTSSTREPASPSCWCTAFPIPTTSTDIRSLPSSRPAIARSRSISGVLAARTSRPTRRSTPRR